MYKFLLTLVVASALVSTESASASRTSDRIPIGRRWVDKTTTTSETEADAFFDEGRRRGYLCAYGRRLSGEYDVVWYTR